VYETGIPYRGRNFRVELERRPGRGLEEHFLDFVYQPAREADGTISGIIVLGIDVTEQRRAHDTLVRGEKLAAVGKMASSIAHEINNPLEAVTNLLYLIETAESLEQAHKHAHMADQELKRVSQIAIQTLQFHRQSSAATMATMSRVVESLLALFQRRFKNNGVVVKREEGEDLPVSCFEGELRQVFSNVISNAIDAMHSGGQLTVRTRNGVRFSDGRRGVVVTIADTGTGIPAEVRERLFDAFFTTKQATGTGLGLWITRGILDKHHGTIRIRSSQRPEAHGTVVRVFLPYDAIPMEADLPSQASKTVTPSL
jgi:signal transduction histidine kinase